MKKLNIARSYVSLDEAGALLGVSACDLIHAGAFNQVQICANIYARAARLSMTRIDTTIDGDYTNIDAGSKDEAQAHDKVFFDWIDRLKINVMPAGIYEVEQDDLRLFEMPEHESIELGTAYKSDDRGLWEVEFDPFVNFVRSDLTMLTTEIKRIQQSGGVDIEAREKKLGTTEKNQLLKMLIGMAMDSYGHDPKALKSDAPKQIADDLAKYGIKITDDTVRKYLKEAANTVVYTMPQT